MLWLICLFVLALSHVKINLNYCKYSKCLVKELLLSKEDCIMKMSTKKKCRYVDTSYNVARYSYVRAIGCIQCLYWDGKIILIVPGAIKNYSNVMICKKIVQREDSC